MSDSYVCSKAKIRCSCGDKISTLTVFPDRTIWLTGEPQANISDHISMRNIAPFGKCHTTRYPATGSATAANHGKLTPMPCVPNTPFPWMGGKDDVLLQNQPALLKSSSCKCVWGGTITFTYDGQVDGTYSELSEEPALSQDELDEEAVVELSAEDLLDGLQMALDAAGMFPGLGAIPDLLNACISACRGDLVGATMSLFAAIPGIGDAAGAAKLMKNGAKIASKTKKAQKTSSNVAELAGARAKREAASGTDELAAKRAKREARAQQERLVEQGIAEGKVTRIETRRNVIIKKEASTGSNVEIHQPTSISRTEVTRASSDYPFRKVTPITPPKQVGTSTSYGAGNQGLNIGGGTKKVSQEENLFNVKDGQSGGGDVIDLNSVRKPKGADEVKGKIDKGENRPEFGI